MTASHPFYCSHCGSYDRRNWNTGGCRYFDDRPERRAQGWDPPCALEEMEIASDKRRAWWKGLWLRIGVVGGLLAILWAVFWPMPAAAHENHRTSSVAFVELDNGNGSAAYIGDNRWLTAKHVATESPVAIHTPTVSFYSVTVEWLCAHCDLAILRTRPQNFVEIPTLEIACRPIRLGEHVSYTGNPQIGSLTPRFLTFYGRVASTELVTTGDGKRFLMNLWADRGASGSAVIGEDGRIIGVLLQVNFVRKVHTLPIMPIAKPLAWAIPLDALCEGDGLT